MQFLQGVVDTPSFTYEKASMVFLPVPYDGTSTWLKGADKGPDALLEASAYLEIYDIETDSQVVERGFFTAKLVTESSTPKAMFEAVKAAVQKLLKDDKFVVLLGGEHSVTPGSVAAHKEKFLGLGVLQLDAHSDLRDEFHGSKHNHACAMSRVKDVVGDALVQVGIRSMDASEKTNMTADNVFFAKDVQDGDAWIDDVINKLPDEVYITIDLDVFDPSIMPSTGTPEPGGLLWWPTLKLLRAVAQKKKVVGFDVVELCPNPANRAPDFLAAKLVYKLLSYVFA